MLVLSRKLGEAIEISGGISVMVVAIRGNSVRLGIEAPQAVQVDRLEIVARRESERRQIESEAPNYPETIETGIVEDLQLQGLAVTTEDEREHVDHFNKIFMIHERIKQRINADESIDKIRDDLDAEENFCQGR